MLRLTTGGPVVLVRGPLDVRGHCVVSGQRAAAPVVQVGAHRKVGEQARFLEHVADGALVGTAEDAGRVVLPDLSPDGETAGEALQAGDTAQHRGLAGTRRAEQRGDAVHGSGEVDGEGELPKRAGKVFFDHNQNARGKTLASIYSPRPSPQAAVSMPVRWEDLTDELYPTDFTILDAKADKLLQKYRLCIENLWGGPQQLRKQMESVSLPGQLD